MKYVAQIHLEVEVEDAREDLLELQYTIGSRVEFDCDVVAPIAATFAVTGISVTVRPKEPAFVIPGPVGGMQPEDFMRELLDRLPPKRERWEGDADG